MQHPVQTVPTVPMGGRDKPGAMVTVLGWIMDVIQKVCQEKIVGLP